MGKGSALARSVGRAFGWLKRSAEIPKTVWTLWSLRTQINFGHIDAYTKVGWVYRCVETKSSNLQQVPVYGVRRIQGRGRGRLQRLPDVHPLSQLLARPTPEDDWATLIEMTSKYLDIYGEALWEMDRASPSDAPSAIHLYPSQSINRVEVDQWKYQKFHLYLNGIEIEVAGSDAVFHRLPSPVNPWRGLSPLNSAFIAADTDYASQVFNSRFFQNAPTPGLVVGYDPGATLQKMTPDDRERMRAEIKQFHAGLGNSFGVMVLGPGQNIKDVGQSAKDMHFEAMRKFNRDEICAVFGVPPIMLGIVENANRCLPGDTLVAAANGYKRIDALKEGELVFSLENGRLMPKRVLNVFNNGPKIVYRVKCEGKTIRCTANHPFLVERSRVERLDRVPHRKTIFWFEWVNAENLKPGDRIATAHRPPFDSCDMLCNGRVADRDFCEAVGLFLGDGSIDYNGPNKIPAALRLAIPENERIRQYYEGVFNRILSTVKKGAQHRGTVTRDGKYSFRASSRALANEFISLGLSGDCYSKSLPQWVWTLPRDLKLAVIKGYLDSDGSVDKRGYASFSSVNGNLLKQFKLLIESMNWTSSALRLQKRNEKRPAWSTGGIYSITTSPVELDGVTADPLYRSRMSGRLNVALYHDGYDYRSLKLLGDGTGLSRVQSVDPCGPEQTFDIEVDGAHNFIADGFIVHNSNSQDQIRMFWEDTMIPRIEDFSSLMNRRISPQFGKDVQIVWDVLSVPAMRQDLKSIGDGVVPLINAGVLTINEVRVDYLDKPPVPWGDENWHLATLVSDPGVAEDEDEAETEKPVKALAEETAEREHGGITPGQAREILKGWKNAALSRINEGAKTPMEAFPVGREAKKIARRLKVSREQSFLMAKTAFTELAVHWDKFNPEDTVVEVFESAMESLPKGEMESK